jgi:hypothetical protein
MRSFELVERVAGSEIRLGGSLSEVELPGPNR